MTISPPSKQFYRDGGTLPPNAPSYIVRPADTELLNSIDKGNFVYVLAPRQMGKSSLMARTVQELRKKELKTAVVDLTKIGESGAVSAEAWYRGIVRLISRELGIPLKIKQWWEEHDGLTNQQCMFEFFADVVLKECSGKIAIFIDEIDSTIPLTFSDDFFAGIRAFYNARATEPEFDRLSFVMLGVATPAELISDTRRTPFNIGTSIELTDFTLNEAMKLLEGLEGSREENTRLLERILHWTGGHPYLTQKLCVHLVSGRHAGPLTPEYIDNLVDRLFFDTAVRSTDHNLSFVGNRIQKSQYRDHLLKLYKKVFSGKKVTHDPRSLVQAAIKLSGLCAVDENNHLCTRNRIYHHVFNRQWIREAETITRMRLIIIPALLLFMIIIAWYAFLLPIPYIRTLELTERDDAAAKNAFTKLQRIPGRKKQARELMAKVWEKNIVSRAIEKGPFEALLCQLKAISYADDSSSHRREAAYQIAGRYDHLAMVLPHNGRVNSIAFSPDGKLIATASWDNQARIWDANSGRPLYSPLKHDGSVNRVRFSPDSSYIATISDDKTVRIWNKQTGKQVTTPLKHSDIVNDFSFSPDTRFIATACNDDTARIWEIGTNKIISVIHGGPVTAVAFSRDGKYIATGSVDKTARIWNARTGKPVSRPMIHRSMVTTVLFSPDGYRLATASHDFSAMIWDSKWGVPLSHQIMHHGSITAIAFSPDGKTIASASNDCTARIWNAYTGIPITEPLHHEGSVNAIAFSPDGDLFATAGNDNTARLWNVHSGRQVLPPFHHESFVVALSFSPDGTLLATASSDNSARIWNIPDITDTSDFTEGFFSTAIFSQDGEQIATAYDSTVTVWSTTTGERMAPALHHPGPVTALAFSPDGSYLAIAGDSTLQIWKTEDDGEYSLEVKQPGAITSLEFTPDGTCIAVVCTDYTARIWNLEGKLAYPPLNHSRPINDIAMDKSGNLIATASDDFNVQLWHITTGIQDQKLTHDGPVYRVLFSNNGDQIATTSEDNTLSIWNTLTGKYRFEPIQFEDGITTVDFNTEGKLAATGCLDKSVRIINTFNGKPLTGPLRHAYPLSAVYFSTDGNNLITIANMQIAYWSIDGTNIRPRTCRLLSSRWKSCIYRIGPSSSKVLIPRGFSRDRLLIDTVNFTSSGEKRLNGAIDSLLMQWEHVTSLKITGDGEIISRYSRKN